MRYVSTRGSGPVSFLATLRQGLAPDGGLYVPENIPAFDLFSPRHETFQDLATSVATSFIGDDMDHGLIRSLVDAAYTHEAFGDSVAPLFWLDTDLGLLQLSSGPTSSFKDIALQFVARLMAWDIAESRSRLTLLVATSGDTGSAVIEAFKGLAGIEVFVLFPDGRVSEFQRKQMTTVVAPNVHTIAIRGTFDDCQRIMKEANAASAFKAWHRLSGVNSTNWARIMAQTTYWLWAAIQARRDGYTKATFAVPSGNLGDALSAYIATQMGASADILVCTNSNDVLDAAIKTGLYAPKESSAVIPTTSPSMDISVASNFERLVYWLLDSQPLPTRSVMDLLRTKGSFELSPALFASAGIRSGSAQEHEVVDAMRTIQRQYGYFLDPHTAVAVSVAQKTGGLTHPVIVAETALPIKFADACRAAYGFGARYSRRHIALLAAEEHYIVLDADTEAVKRHMDDVLG